MKNQKGITLLALVVTIIVLLILAGISIAMLTGENGIITNAQEAATANAYYGATEQVKLAYMAVRTEIMAQTVKNGQYDATGSDATNALAEIVTKDFGSDPKWSVSAADGVITITYSDSAIDQGVIGNVDYHDQYNNNGVPTTNNTARTVVAPLSEGQVKYTITLYPQNASLEIDVA